MTDAPRATVMPSPSRPTRRGSRTGRLGLPRQRRAASLMRAGAGGLHQLVLADHRVFASVGQERRAPHCASTDRLALGTDGTRLLAPLVRPALERAIDDCPRPFRAVFRIPSQMNLSDAPAFEEKQSVVRVVEAT